MRVLVARGTRVRGGANESDESLFLSAFLSLSARKIVRDLAQEISATSSPPSSSSSGMFFRCVSGSPVASCFFRLFRVIELASFVTKQQQQKTKSVCDMKTMVSPFPF